MQHPVPDRSIRHFVFTEDPEIMLPKDSDNGKQRPRRRVFLWWREGRQTDKERTGERHTWLDRFLRK